MAKQDAQGLSWGSPTVPVFGNLTGFSHGAAGVGYTLLELFRATGDGRFRTAAEQAFTYERSLYNPDQKNWPDLRDLASRLGQVSEGPPLHDLLVPWRAWNCAVAAARAEHPQR